MATNVYLERAHELQDKGFARKDEERANALKLQTAPLSQALQSDQTRLALYADPDDPGKPIKGKENEYNATISRMTDTIGKLRTIYGQKAPSATPNAVESGGAGLHDKLHITNHLKAHVAEARAKAAADYGAQNRSMAGDYAAGVASAHPDAWEKFRTTWKEINGGQEPPEDVKTEFARKQGGLAEAEKSEAANWMQVDLKFRDGTIRSVEHNTKTGEYRTLGKQPISPAELDGAQSAPKPSHPVIKQGTVNGVQHYAIVTDAGYIDAGTKKPLPGFKPNPQSGLMGTWGIVENAEGQPVLLNTKTGDEKEAPDGVHKSGYFAKQIAPLEAAGLNIDDYIDGKVYDGAGDLALQHEFFTATQPATGFRMTKVQQDILQGSQSWLNSLEAKAHHALYGTWFSDKQREQIAKAAKDAIAAKISVLSATPLEGPKTKKLKQTKTDHQGGGTVIVVSPEDMK